MSWKVLTRDALAAQLNEKELIAYSQAGNPNGDDPIEEILANTAALVRGYIRSAGLVRPSSDEFAVPRALFGSALNYARFDYLTRFRLPVSEDRRKARDEAAQLFDLVRDGKFKVDDGINGETEPKMTATSPAMLDKNTPYLLD